MTDPQPFQDSNVRSPDYYVARTSVRCWYCGLPTWLLALALPHGHETLEADAAPDGTARDGSASDETPGVHDAEAWQRAGGSAFVFYVQQLPQAVQDRLTQLSRFFRLSFSEATLNSYWANHCEHCGTLLGDHELHCEPDGAFMPSSEAEAANIRLLHIAEPFAAVTAGYALEPEFFGSCAKE